MFPPDFVPIEMDGISIITAMILFFFALVSCAYYRWDKNEHTRLKDCIDEEISDLVGKVDLIFVKIDDINANISEIKSRVSSTDEAINWLKKYCEDTIK